MRDIEKLQDGQKGVVFKITDDSGQARILKLQAENPARAIVGTHLLMRAGVETPVMEPAVGPGLNNLMDQVEQFLQKPGNQDHDAANLLRQALAKAADPGERLAFKQVVLMDFAQGQDLEKMARRHDFKQEVLVNPEFQKQLGKIMAADAFTGNPDRFAARIDPRNPDSGQIHGWYNQNNLIIEGAGAGIRLKAIDNDFRPGANVDGETIYGGELHGGQWGSVAAASSQHFKREIFAIIQRLEQQGGVQLDAQELRNFINNAAEGAREAMDVLLQAGIEPADIRRMMAAAGENNPRELRAAAEGFDKQKQLIAMLRNDFAQGLAIKPSVAEMAGIAGRGGPLSTEKVLEGLGMSREDAQEIAGSREKMDRFNNLMRGEKGAHVPADFKLSVREAAKIAQDESVYRQFTHKPGGQAL